jgi:hypothetical protein
MPARIDRKVLTMAGLGTNMRQTAASGEITGRTEELHQQRRGGAAAYQRLLSSGVRKHLVSSGGAHRRRAEPCPHPRHTHAQRHHRPNDTHWAQFGSRPRHGLGSRKHRVGTGRAGSARKEEHAAYIWPGQRKRHVPVRRPLGLAARIDSPRERACERASERLGMSQLLPVLPRNCTRRLSCRVRH